MFDAAIELPLLTRLGARIGDDLGLWNGGGRRGLLLIHEPAPPPANLARDPAPTDARPAANFDLAGAESADGSRARQKLPATGPSLELLWVEVANFRSPIGRETRA